MAPGASGALGRRSRAMPRQFKADRTEETTRSERPTVPGAAALPAHARLAALAHGSARVQADAALQRLADTRPAPADPAVVQRVPADYTHEEIRAAIEDARAKVTKKKPKDTDYGKAMAAYLQANCDGLATAYKSVAVLEKACTGWWNRPSEVAAPVVVAPRNPLVDPTITFDTGHGDLHFVGNPTDKKSKWSLSKTDAMALMEATIGLYLDVLGVNSATSAAFYVTAQHSATVGSYFPKVKNSYPTTDHYTMQVQVDYANNAITYHGFPDERIVGFALGCSINKTDANKLASR
jgi:hypothetical protein